MSKKMYESPAITRRQLAAATVSLLLAACGRSVTQKTPTATREVAQLQATDTAVPPAETPAPADTATTAPGDTPAPESTPASSATATLEPTPQCDDDDETPAQAEGPFYTPDTPQRTSFLEGGTGTRLVVTGRVLSTDCVPIAGAILDFWHADDAGQYDNEGYRFRGHQFTDAEGNFRLETIIPARYTGRTRHIHVKVQGQNTPLLTTQLYFPGEPQNETDGLFNPALLMDVQDADDGKRATFDFVLEQA